MLQLRSATFAAVLAVFAICGLTTHTASAQSASAPSSASAFVQQLGDRAIIELTDKSLTDSQRVKRMRQMLTESFDVPAVSQFVLGTYWRQATEQERQQFIELYQVVVAHTYAGLFKKYSGQQFKVLRERAIDDDTTIVYGQILQPTGAEPVAIELTVKKEGGSYKAVDIRVEGISMPLTHRKEYASVIQRNRGQVSALIKILQQKAQSLEAETPSQ